MADAIFASLGGGLRFKRPDANSTKSKPQGRSSAASSSSFGAIKAHPASSSSKKAALTAKTEQELGADSESDSDELFSISRQKSALEEDFDDIEQDISGEEPHDDEEGLENPNNFVMDRVIKVDGSDLPFEKLNKVAGEKLIEVGKTNVVRSRISNFAQLGVSDWLLTNIESKLQWTIPTHVQQMAIPSLLSGRDVQIASPTGSGKTAAFLVPILQLLIIQQNQESLDKQKLSKKSSSKTKTSEKKAQPEAVATSDEKLPVIFPLNLVVAPTLELATQIFHQSLLLCDCEAAKLVSVELLSKSNIRKRRDLLQAQRAGVEHATDKPPVRDTIDLVVSTPSRVIQLVEEGAIDLSRVQHLVLDEVDRLMTDEMLGQADAILSASKESKTRRIAFFSATIMPSVESLAASVLQHPIRARIGMKNTAADHVTQHLLYTGSEEGKMMSLQRLLTSGQVRAPVLIFMQSKFRTTQLLQGLGVAPQQKEVTRGGISSLGFTMDFITGDRTESQRREALLNFRSGQTTILVTTDLLARGLDFKAVATVINFDMPTSATTYIHRIGRTGRVGGVTGEAWTLFTDADVEHIAPIANVMVRSGQIEHVPAWILNKPLQKSKGHHRSGVVQREDVGGSISASSVTSYHLSKRKFFNPSRKIEEERKEKHSKHKSEHSDASKKRKSPSSRSDVSSPPRKIAKKSK